MIELTGRQAGSWQEFAEIQEMMTTPFLESLNPHCNKDQTILTYLQTMLNHI